MQRTPGVMHVANRADVGGLPTVVRVSPHSSECATSQQLPFSRSYLSSYHGVIPRNPRDLRFLPSGMQNCFELLMERYVSFLRRSQPPFIRRCQTSLPENSRGFIAGEEKYERESHELLPPSVGPAKLGHSSRPLISRIRGFPFERLPSKVIGDAFPSSPTFQFTRGGRSFSRSRLKAWWKGIYRPRWDRGQQKPGLAIPGLAIIATSSRGLAIYH